MTIKLEQKARLSLLIKRTWIGLCCCVHSCVSWRSFRQTALELKANREQNRNTNMITNVHHLYLITAVAVTHLEIWKVGTQTRGYISGVHFQKCSNFCKFYFFFSL